MWRKLSLSPVRPSWPWLISGKDWTERKNGFLRHVLLPFYESDELDGRYNFHAVRASNQPCPTYQKNSRVFNAVESLLRSFKGRGSQIYCPSQCWNESAGRGTLGDFLVVWFRNTNIRTWPQREIAPSSEPFSHDRVLTQYWKEICTILFDGLF